MISLQPVIAGDLVGFVSCSPEGLCQVPVTELREILNLRSTEDPFDSADRMLMPSGNSLKHR